MRKNKAVQSLILMAESMGYSVVLKKSLASLGIKDAIGYCSRDEKKIVVSKTCKKGKPHSISDIVFVLAHEVRHAQHHILGLFPDYYIEASRLPLFCVESMLGAVDYGLKAEYDCDKFATDMVKILCSKRSRYSGRKYPVHKVWTLRAYNGAKMMTKKGKISKKFENFLNYKGF